VRHSGARPLEPSGEHLISRPLRTKRRPRATNDTVSWRDSLMKLPFSRCAVVADATALRVTVCRA
jgi:hypothetical protein